MKLDLNKVEVSSVSFAEKLGYASGNLGYGIILQIISTYLVFYATAVLSLPGSLVGLAVSISVIWDSVSDPVMGYISDRTNLRRFGRRHIYILLGTIFMALFNYLLWVIDPAMSTKFKFAWILVIILLLKSFMTMFATPYTALGAEMSSDYNERTSIQSVKMSLFLLGLALATAASMLLFFQPTKLYPVGQLNPMAYKNMALTSSLLMLVFGLTCFFSTKKHMKLPEDSISSAKKNTLIVNLLGALKNFDYRIVVLGYLFTNIASSIIGSIGLHVFTYTFHMDNLKIAIIFGLQLIISIACQPFWIWFTKKYDKKPAIMLGLLLSLIASTYFILLVLFKNVVSKNILLMVPFAFIMGFGSGGLFTIPNSMIADTTDKGELLTGERIEGVYYGGMTLGYKLSQSAAIFLLGLLLDFVNFDPALSVQSDSTTTILGLVLGVGCILSFLLAILTYRRYTITKESALNIQSELFKRKRK